MSELAVQRPRFSVAMDTQEYKQLINSTLRDPNRARQFVASITSAVSANPDLHTCSAATILSGALLGESLNLAHSPTLGHYYLVPFDDNRNNRRVATFILGYKGYIQLAIRSGQYKRLNVLAIKKGELVGFNPLDEEIEINLIEDELKRETAPTIGYYAMFEYVNGFRKAIYWTKEKMERHALRYSKAYKAKKGFSFWEKDFDAMAYKTMLRQLISKWGIMSVEMQNAMSADGNSIAGAGESMTVDYIDAENEESVPISTDYEVMEEDSGKKQQAKNISMEDI